jgi:hypothetical protein
LKGLSRWWEFKVAGAELLSCWLCPVTGCLIINTVSFILIHFVGKLAGSSRRTPKKLLIFHGAAV